MDFELPPPQSSRGRGLQSPLVEYVLAAEFDILKGSSLTHQYPRDTGADPSKLAELMLPDGAHRSKEDWFMIILNQRATSNWHFSDLSKTPPINKQLEGSVCRANAYIYSHDICEWNTISKGSRQVVVFGSGLLSVWDSDLSNSLIKINVAQTCFYSPIPDYIIIFDSNVTLGLVFDSEEEHALVMDYLLKLCNTEDMHLWGREYPVCLPLVNKRETLVYSLNLVQTKHISGIDRGARVKGLAVISRYRWISVFKPLIVLALDKFFLDQDLDILKSLYDAINSTDLSYFPILTTAEKRLLKFSTCSNLLKDKYDKILEFIYEHRNTIEQEKRYRNVMERISYNLYNVKHSTEEKIDLSIMPIVKNSRFFETKVRFRSIDLPIRISLMLYPEELPELSMLRFLSTFGIQQPTTVAWNSTSSGKIKSARPKSQGRNSFYWHPHLDTGINTSALAVIINSILTEKRVVFLGDKSPAGEVAEHVLAAGYVASGGGSIFTGVQERLFPYVSLSSIDYLFTITGYIIGVTNPLFGEQLGWWDVLCDINTGKVTINTISNSIPCEIPLVADLGRSKSPMPENQSILDVQQTEKESEAGLSYQFRRMSDVPSASGKYSNGQQSAGFQKERRNSPLVSYYNDSNIANEIAAGVRNHIEENILRQKLEHYTNDFILVAAAHEILTLSKTSISIDKSDILFPNWGPNIDPPVREVIKKRRNDISALKNRIEGWRNTRGYLYYKNNFDTALQNRPIKEVNIEQVVDLLSDANCLANDANTVKLFSCMNDILSEATDIQIIQFLSLMCCSDRSLITLTIGLFHYRWEVRYCTTRVLSRILDNPTGKQLLSNINPFIKTKMEKSMENLKCFNANSLESIKSSPLKNYNKTYNHGDRNRIIAQELFGNIPAEYENSVIGLSRSDDNIIRKDLLSKTSDALKIRQNIGALEDLKNTKFSMRETRSSSPSTGQNNAWLNRDNYENNTTPSVPRRMESLNKAFH